MYQYAYLPYRAELIKFQSSPRAAMYDLALFRINTLHHSKWEKKNKTSYFKFTSQNILFAHSATIFTSTLNFFCQSYFTFFLLPHITN